MTWKKTKVQRLLRTEGNTWPQIKILQPYRARNYRRTGMPSGWRQMCKAVGLRPEDHTRRTSSWSYLVGRGRRWRINASGTFDMSCPNADFDRWANSTERTFPLPKTKTELELYVRFAHR